MRLTTSALFRSTAVKEDRSKMNVCFVMNDPALEKKFLEFAEQHKVYGIKGHRSAGGFRASIYNAMPISSVRYLIDLMDEFEKENYTKLRLEISLQYEYVYICRSNSQTLLPDFYN